MTTRWIHPAAVPLGALALTCVLAACGPTPAPGGPSAPTVTAGPTRLLTAQPVSADGALTCPATVTDGEGMTVPEKPQGLDGNARLLPNRVPESLVDCSYPVLDLTTGGLTAPFPLKERTVVPASERGAVVEQLTWAPRGEGTNKVCTAIGGAETVHLVGARYADAIVWVAAKADPNSCSGSTNGDFVSPAALGVWLERLVGNARTAQVPPDSACFPASFGRLGDDTSLAPTGDPRVTVCRVSAAGEQRPTFLDATQSARVVAALRSVRSRPSDHTCTGADPRAGRDYRLVLTYDRGPAATVTVSPTCTPQLMGNQLAADDARSVTNLVERWSPPIPGPDPDGAVSSGGSGGSTGTGSTGTGSTGTGPTHGAVAPDQPQSVPGSTGSGAEPAGPTAAATVS